VTPGLVAQVVALAFLSQGRDAPDGVFDAWLFVLADLADGPDVPDITGRVIRAQQ
jgi:hypothetical protein